MHHILGTAAAKAEITNNNNQRQREVRGGTVGCRTAFE